MVCLRKFIKRLCSENPKSEIRNSKFEIPLMIAIFDLLQKLFNQKLHSDGNSPKVFDFTNSMTQRPSVVMVLKEIDVIIRQFEHTGFLRVH